MSTDGAPRRGFDERFWRQRDWWRKVGNSGFGIGFLGFLLFAVLSGAAVWALMGTEVLIEAIIDDVEMVGDTLPRVFIAVSVAALLWVLLPQEKIAALVGRDSGMKGLVIATIAGTVTPGGPSSAFALLAMLGAAGADRGAMVAYIAAWATLGLQRILVWDVPFMGIEFSMIRLLVSLPLPILAGLIARSLPLEVRLRDPEPDAERPR